MAGKCRKFVEVQVDGVVETTVRAAVVNELIKFVLHQRNQVPMYVDQLRELLARESQLPQNTSVEQHSVVKRIQKCPRSEQQELVRTIDSLLQIVRDVFDGIHLIKQVLILLGPNIILPRDAYLIHLPTEFYEGQSLSARSCIQSVFRAIYRDDVLSGAAPLNAGTNLFLLFLAPRSCHHSKFKLIPHLKYSLPCSAGAVFEVKLVSRAGTVTAGNAELDSPVSAIRTKELDMSGVCALNDDEPSVDNDTIDCIDSSEDYVWFQAPVTVKGYKQKVPDCVGFWG